MMTILSLRLRGSPGGTLGTRTEPAEILVREDPGIVAVGPDRAKPVPADRFDVPQLGDSRGFRCRQDPERVRRRLPDGAAGGAGAFRAQQRQRQRAVMPVPPID